MRLAFLRASVVCVHVVCTAAIVNAQATTPPAAQKPPVRSVAVKPAAPKPPAEMTNADVLKMVSAKLAEDIILSAIEDAKNKAFDLSATGLIALKNGGASDEVVRVMQGRPRTPPAPPPAVAPAVRVVEPPAVSPTPAAESSSTAATKEPEGKKASTKRSFLKGGFLGLGIGKSRGKGNDDEKAADSSGAAQPTALKNGETAIISTGLSPTDATAKVKAYFNSKDVEYTVNPDTGRISTDWYGERKCGPGFHKCANKATVRVAAEEGRTALRVQVVERKRESGMNQKPWKEDSTSKGKETAQLAAELERFLTAGPPR
jgi:hypothetical protein